MIEKLKNRVAKLEQNGGMTGTGYTLPGGAHSRIRNRDILDAMSEAIEGKQTLRATILLRAESSSDGSHLHELCQALAAGPIETETSTN